MTCSEPDNYLHGNESFFYCTEGKLHSWILFTEGCVIQCVMSPFLLLPALGCSSHLQIVKTLCESWSVGTRIRLKVPRFPPTLLLLPNNYLSVTSVCQMSSTASQNLHKRERKSTSKTVFMMAQC